MAHVVEDVVDAWCPSDVYPEEWDHDGLFAALGEVFPVEGSPEDLASVEDAQELKERFTAAAIAAYDRKEDAVTPAVMRELERVVLLNITDTKWREHLYEMDYLQEGIHLRAYAQRDPLTEYRREAFDMFELLTQSIREDFVKYIYRVELVRQDQQAAAPRLQRVQENKDDVASGAGGAGEAPADAGMGTRSGGAAPQAVSDKVPRNGPCPCGSGRKYKKCHGAAA